MAVITSFPIKMSVEEAKREARKRNGFLARLISGIRGKDQEIVMKTIYIENRLITFEITTNPLFLEKIFKKEAKPRKSKIRMIANGSTCGVSYYDGRGVETAEAEVAEEAVQHSDFSDEEMVTRGNALARRILRRRVGGNFSLEPSEIQSVYRPYHVAFFGKPEEGKKIYYVPVAADGCTVKRTF
ncbi:MAG: hypothetical protein ACLUEQ_06805 [Cloacibacillus evryensis]